MAAKIFISRAAIFYWIAAETFFSPIAVETRRTGRRLRSCWRKSIGLIAESGVWQSAGASTIPVRVAVHFVFKLASFNCTFSSGGAVQTRSARYA